MTLRKLTLEEVEKFAIRKGVKKVAVENFLMTVHNNQFRITAQRNKWLDAKLYGWNKATIEAIQAGIELSDGG